MLRQFFSFLLSFLFPQLCIACKKEGVILCESCKKKILYNQFQKEGKCGDIDKLIVMSPYENNPVLQKLVKRLKYYGAFDAAHVCGQLLRHFLEKEHIPQNIVISYVPLHWWRFFERGFNQSELIAEELASPKRLLRRIRYTKQQAKLHKNDRLENVKGAFQCIEKDLPQRVLLVDDIASTCSSLNECAKVLKKAGVKEVWAVVLARNF